MGNVIPRFFTFVYRNLWEPVVQPFPFDVQDAYFLNNRARSNHGDDTDTDDNDSVVSQRLPAGYRGPYPIANDHIIPQEGNEREDDDDSQFIRYLDWNDLNDAYLLYSNALFPGFYRIRLNNLMIFIGINENGEFHVFQADFNDPRY